MDANYLILIDVLMRGLTVILALLISYEFHNYSADVVRSRLFVSYNKLKFSFYILCLSLLFFFFDPLLSPFPSPGDTGYKYSFAMFFFQASLVFLLLNIYAALRPAHKVL